MLFRHNFDIGEEYTLIKDNGDGTGEFIKHVDVIYDKPTPERRFNNHSLKRDHGWYHQFDKPSGKRNKTCPFKGQKF